METRTIRLSEIKPNQSNPRTIDNTRLDKLVNSVKNFPEMREVREIVVNKDMVILGGNMRYQAMLKAGIEQAPIKIVDWPEEKQKEFIIKDNIESGEWNYDTLANEWDTKQLTEWGLDTDFITDDEDQTYTKKLGDIHYEPSDTKPNINELYDRTKADELLQSIENAKADGKIPDDVYLFLQLSANRHIIFDYAKIADFYTHTTDEAKKLFEQSALVLIDYNNAINNGYVELSQKIKNAQTK